MLWLMLVLPLVLLALGLPFFLVLLTASTLVVVWLTSVPPTAIPQIMFGSIGNFALLAVPFFIFTGELMGRGGMARRLVVLVMALFGSFRGSLPITTVGAAALSGPISGSPAAPVQRPCNSSVRASLPDLRTTSIGSTLTKAGRSAARKPTNRGERPRSLTPYASS